MVFITTASSHGTNYKVSATFPNGGGSNYCVALDCAPAGESIYSTTIGGGDTTDKLINCTSFSAPIVAGFLFMNNGVFILKKLLLPVI